METIEIGAVKLNAKLEQIDEFSVYVRPVKHPILSEFCVRFTSIKQDDLAQADTFPAAFKRFFDWMGPEKFVWYSWSDYDRHRLMTDLADHLQPVPPQFLNHKDLKKLYAQSKDLEQMVGMRRALKDLEIEFEGRQHRGLDDAKNTAEILRHVLQVLIEN